MIRRTMGKYYAVQNGRNTGVYKSWDACKANVHQYSGAKYKSFSTQAEAAAFAAGGSNHSSGSSSLGVYRPRATRSPYYSSGRVEASRIATRRPYHSTTLASSSARDDDDAEYTYPSSSRSSKAPSTKSSIKRSSSKAASSAEDTYTLRFDGGARGNPGPAGSGAQLINSAGEEVWSGHRYIGNATNNEAEWRGLVDGLQAAQERGARNLKVQGDSQLVIRQAEGRYAVRAEHLKPLHKEAMTTAKGFDSVKYEHIPRHENGVADALANRAMDTKGTALPKRSSASGSKSKGEPS